MREPDYLFLLTALISSFFIVKTLIQGGDYNETLGIALLVTFFSLGVFISKRKEKGDQ